MTPSTKSEAQINSFATKSDCSEPYIDGSENANTAVEVPISNRQSVEGIDLIKLTCKTESNHENQTHSDRQSKSNKVSVVPTHC